MNPIKTATARSKKFVTDHKVGLALTAGITIGLVINKLNMNQVDEFLDEHGLKDEYWNTNED